MKRKNVVIYENKVFKIDIDTFNSLNSKGFGIKENSNLFLLDGLEVLFLLERKKIIVKYNKKELDFESVLKKVKIDFKKYLVFKNLVKKGFLVKTATKYGVDFRVYEKGAKMGEEHSKWLVKVIREDEKFLVKNLLSENRIAHSTKKKLLFAIIDFENSITYIENKWVKL